MENQKLEVLSRHDLSKAIAEEIKGKTSKRLTIDDVTTVLCAIQEVVKEQLMAGKKVRLPGLGDFSGIVKPAGEGRDPRTGEVIQLDERMSVKFKASRTLRDEIKRLFKESK